ncbi:site-specific recombinase [Oryzisolibacter sp. LB2S]|uniref:site-specific recombinase n=1 Tax=Alicycliphilus soli TaxID=3228789 RepID=UPI00345A1FBF
MSRATPDLAQLLARLDPAAPLAERHLQLLALLDWVRGHEHTVEAATGRVALLVQAAEQSPATRQRLSAWWAELTRHLDITTLLADFGFAQRTSMASELAERLRYKLLPVSPETQDASELFMLALPHELDARWLAALDEELLARLLAVLLPAQDAGDDAASASANEWQRALLDAIAYCAGQILATGFAPELRLRMSEEVRAAQPFHALLRDAESLRVEVLHPLRTDDRLQQAVQGLRERLDACRAAVNNVYAHFEDNGISVGLVFRLRQLRARILRVRELLECLLSPRPAASAMQLLSHLVLVGRQRRSVRTLLATNSSLVAAKVAERSAETGEHYITRTGGEYLSMVRQAAGGGLVMAVTTLIKFGLYALALSAFWGGFMAGVNYAVSFVLIQLLHFTVATKQPAMTAPAMAAKLKDLEDDAAVESFVDEVAHLVRSQVAAVLGNVLLVFPGALLLALFIAQLWGRPAIDAEHALHTLDTLHLLGPSLLFAAFTGVLLFASSILAGWVENWFVLHRLDSAIEYNPRITAALGVRRAARWAHFLRGNISGLAANVSLGFMLGLAPAFAAFFGLGLEVRHVTLTTGQIGVAAATLGHDVLHLPAFWWAVALVPFNGALNVIVSFYLAFRVALRAHNVGRVDRNRIYRALRRRLRRAPLGFFLPTRGSV